MTEKKMIKKVVFISEREIDFIQKKMDEWGVSLAEVIRRMLDQYIESEKKGGSETIKRSGI